MRTYELVFIADPRLSDEEVVGLAEEYKGLLEEDGETKVSKEESWGRRKFAYPIDKFNEGRYHIFYIDAPGTNTIPGVEQRMRQNDKIIRYLTVRTDEDLKRAASKGKKAAITTLEGARAEKAERQAERA